MDARLITIEVKKNHDDQKKEESLLAYYMEKDVRKQYLQIWTNTCTSVLLLFTKIIIISHKVVVQSLFGDQLKFEPIVEGEKLEIESIIVYYVDEKEPTHSMQMFTTGLLIVTGVFILAACLGILILVSSFTEIMFCIDRWQGNIYTIRVNWCRESYSQEIKCS